ncbi:MAG: 16S rRNA (cytosine(1402)-N(4))-methyltransferase RsmH [Legionellales bacterium]|jgi:16S rRNA (cytosine1402-N4)-methyltransferase|nr:16S rRNA (cytosine(1402)-N(4))-methyltransferase RsmH [Legionellales bacterium]
MQNLHTSVMLQEAVEALKIKSDGIYIDATFGGGGHSKLILEQLGENGRLFSYDKDSFAENIALNKDFADSRFVFKKTSFSEFGSDMIELGLEGKISGILFDLGVSSPQLDDADRGFSFMQDGPLDMRMNNSRGFTAADWVNSTPEKEIADAIFQYGDERLSRRIAKSIIRERKIRKITRTLQLADIVAGAVPRRPQGKHPATRTFQAIRIVVNSEYEDLLSALKNSIEVLEEKGRLVALSFHSGEDRIVKHFIRNSEIPTAQTQSHVARLLQVGRVTKASDREISSNPRARSVKMRIAEKIFQ